VLCSYLRGPFTLFGVSLLVSQLASLGLILQFPLEHQRSYKPSEPITLYLLASVLCDVILLTMPSSAGQFEEISRPVFLRCCMHSGILLYENFGSRPASNLVVKQKSPEELDGILSRAFFTWINPILLRGYKHVLTDDDLPPLSRDMKPEITAKAILRTWSQRGLSESHETCRIHSHNTSQARNEMDITCGSTEKCESTLSCCDCTALVLDFVSLFSAQSNQAGYQICFDAFLPYRKRTWVLARRVSCGHLRWPCC
jgi:hypothetical protein